MAPKHLTIFKCSGAPHVKTSLDTHTQIKQTSVSVLGYLTLCRYLLHVLSIFAFVSLHLYEL